jgi:predicted TIM-barrel fold metal-dependent hydrolase
MSDRDVTLGSASRRDFIAGVAATGAAAALVPALGGFAAAASPMRRMHPTFGPCCTKNMVTGLIAPNLEFPFDTTRTIISLVTSGTTTRFPNIRFVFSHGGGALFGVYGRLENLGTTPQFKDKFPAGMVAELKKLYYDTASMNAETSITALLRAVPSSQLLLGSDYPLVATKPLNEAIVRAVAEFEEYKPSPQLKAQVERDNAMRLVRRLAKV